MATLYFNAAVNHAWDNISNWWQDTAFTVSAVGIPASGDTVYVEATVGTGPSAAITLAALYIAQINNSVTLESSGAGISTTGDVTVGKSTYLSGYINANLTVGGTAYFYGESQNEKTITVSLAIFYKNSINYYAAIIAGNAVFNDSTNNYSSIEGDATFNDSSVNLYSTITGNATFNDVSRNYYDTTIDGNATFNDQSTNYGLVSGNASVYYPVARPLGGTVTGTITYFGYPYFYFNAAVDNTWDNVSNWWRDSGFSVPSAIIPTNGSTVYVEGDVTAGPSVAVTLAALFIAQINNAATLGSSGAGISITGDLTVGVGSSLYGRIDNCNLTIEGTAYFYGGNGGNSSTLSVDVANFYLNSSNYGTGQGSTSNGVITGDVLFFNSTANYCTIDGPADFNDNSYNASGGTVENANFNDSSYNASGATVEEFAYFDNNSYNASGATVGGDADFTDNAYNANGATIGGDATFNSDAYNAAGAVVEGSAFFYDSSYNNGLVSGNASVYYPVTRPLGGTVTGTITYIGYPAFRTLYFNAAVDDTWDNAYNWWLDSAFTISAFNRPADGDTVYVEANVTAGPSVAVTLAALFIAQINNGVILGDAGAGISTTGDLTVGSGIYLYGRINSANLTIGGTAYFYGGNGGNSSTLSVDVANFYLNSSNYGTGQGSTSNGVITGNAIFHDNSKNYCSISGSATFNDISGNNSGGDITGSATFNDSSYNATGGTVGGNANFKNNSSNGGLVSGNASVYYPVTRPLGGTVTGIITYINYP